MNKFLLLLGPSGVGKSSIIEKLCQLDNRFVYISPYMTRPLRKGEKNKISVSDERMDKMWHQGKLLVINEFYGIRYATPKSVIVETLINGNIPIIDWPISKIDIMVRFFPNQLYIVYISPPSIHVLHERLLKDGRDIDGSRFQSACEELKKYWSSQYTGIYDFEIISKENQISRVAQSIYINYLKSIQ